MVSHAAGRLLLTEGEAAVMAVLATGPADIAPRTDHQVGADGTELLRWVARRHVRALARAGLVDVDDGGTVRLTAAGQHAIAGPD